MNRYNLVIIIANSHRVGFLNVACPFLALDSALTPKSLKVRHYSV